MSLNSFLAEIALANLNIEIREQEEKVYRLEEALRWEQRRKRFLSSLYLMLDRADLTRKEINYVLIGISEDDPDTLLSKIRFVTDRIQETDPAKMAIQICSSNATDISDVDVKFRNELATEARKRKLLV